MSTTSTTTAAVFRRPGDGERAQQLHASVTLKLDAGQVPGRRAGAAEFHLPAGFGPPLHVHHREDELLQVLEGALLVVCGGAEAELEAGAFAYLPRGVPHTFRVQGEQPARMLAVFTPGGIERLFIDAQPGTFDELSARFGVEYVGAPLE
jgi:mannose-6-phosphate isomerase-like protein (cupin superfamily)